MYCPNCEKDIKAGSEKKSMSLDGQIMMGIGFVGSLLGLWSGSHPLVVVIIGVIFVGGGYVWYVWGRKNTRTVCPACEAVLLPENPFEEL